MSHQIVKVGQLQIRYLVDGSQGGGLGLFEMAVPAGARVPPPHSHTDNEECVYVLKGVLRYSVDGDTRDLEPGQWMSTPKGSVHHFSNAGSETARALVMMTPDVGEQYFHDVGAVVNTGGPPDLAKLMQVMKQYGLVPAAGPGSPVAKGRAEDTGRVVALAALLLGAGVGIGTAAGVFDRLGAVELASLSLFAALYGLATYGLDRGVRQFILASQVAPHALNAINDSLRVRPFQKLPKARMPIKAIRIILRPNERIAIEQVFHLLDRGTALAQNSQRIWYS